METVGALTKIIKRNGSVEDFNPSKITTAILKAGQATGEFEEKIAINLTVRVLTIANQMIAGSELTVEEIQDIVEEVLITSPYRKTAKAYIIYRDQHAKIREITSKMRGTPDLDTILNTAVQELGKALGVSRAFVRLSTGPGTSDTSQGDEAKVTD